MKFLKQLGILLLIIIAIATVLVLVLPVKQKLARTTIINAKPAVVYEYLSRLANFKKWSAWSQHDSTLTNSITGTDGMLGAVNNWKGDPVLSGEGKIQITSLEINQEIEHHVSFLSPSKMEAASEFDLVEVNGQTQVTWSFETNTPRPGNVFYLFNSLDKRMGKNFEESLRNLKATLEKNSGTATKEKTYEVLPMNFPTTSYAIRRQTLKWGEMPAFFAQHLPDLYKQSMDARATAGSPSGLFYVWDKENQQADMAAAIPISQGTTFSDTSIMVIDLPGSKAVYVDYYGPYENLIEAYSSIEKYLAANNLKQKYPAIEQYITDPKLEKDSNKWLTKVICLVE